MNMRFPFLAYLPGGMLCLLAIGAWLQSAQFPEMEEGYPGPALFPQLIAVGLAFCGILLLIQEMRPSSNAGEDAPAQSDSVHPKTLLMGLGLSVVFAGIYPLTGFIPAMLLLVGGVALLLKVKPLPAAILAITVTLSIYGLFSGLLNVVL